MEPRIHGVGRLRAIQCTEDRHALRDDLRPVTQANDPPSRFCARPSVTIFGQRWGNIVRNCATFFPLFLDRAQRISILGRPQKGPPMSVELLRDPDAPDVPTVESADYHLRNVMHLVQLMRMQMTHTPNGSRLRPIGAPAPWR